MNDYMCLESKHDNYLTSLKNEVRKTAAILSLNFEFYPVLCC